MSRINIVASAGNTVQVFQDGEYLGSFGFGEIGEDGQYDEDEIIEAALRKVRFRRNRKRDGPMTGAELQGVRRKLGLSQAALGASIGVSASQVYSMESGRRDIGLCVELAVRYRLNEAGIYVELDKRLCEESKG